MDKDVKHAHLIKKNHQLVQYKPIHRAQNAP